MPVCQPPARCLASSSRLALAFPLFFTVFITFLAPATLAIDEPSQFPVPTANISAAILVLAYARTSPLRRTLRSIAAATPPHLIHSLPLFVSVDHNPRAHRVIRIANSEPNVKAVWHHIPTPSPNLSTTPSARHNIARHYHFALSRAFDIPALTHLIVFEDDLLLAPDALLYLHAALPYLQPPQPHALVCASTWNDNAAATHPSPVVPTSFFPGLGWALHRSLWLALRPHWPSAITSQPALTGWDFWLRRRFADADWACLTPSLPRVRHLAAGSNVASDDIISFARLPLATKEDIPSIGWPSALVQALPSLHHSRIQHLLFSSFHVPSLNVALRIHTDVAVPYRRHRYAKLARVLSLWSTPRGHFQHVLLLRGPHGHNLLLYDQLRVRTYFSLPTPLRLPAMAQVHRAPKATSCTDVCNRVGQVCTPAALDVVNDCHVLNSTFDGKCHECAFETGRDLPARVRDDAPIDTAGICLVAESGLGDDGQFVCEGVFEWTERACACLKKRVADAVTQVDKRDKADEEATIDNDPRSSIENGENTEGTTWHDEL